MLYRSFTTRSKARKNKPLRKSSGGAERRKTETLLSLLVEAGEKILEYVERPRLSVHCISLAQSVADSGMHGRRRHLDESPGGSLNHGFMSRVDIAHGVLNALWTRLFQPLRTPNGTD
jgi:hypothetical protein